MLVRLNDNQEITDYATIGGLTNAIEIKDEKLPDDFTRNFKSSFYLLKDDEVVENPNYQEITIDGYSGPTQIDKDVATVTYQQMMTTQDVTTLQTQNAQMAYQLMMLGGTK